MKTSQLWLLSVLVLASATLQDPAGSEQKTPKKGHPITSFPKEEALRLGREIEGSWMLIDYDDPVEFIEEGAFQGFATFHDGFLNMFIQAHGMERRFLHVAPVFTVDCGAYRYRFDEMAHLQTSSVLSFSNLTENGEVAPDRAGEVDEYSVTLKEGTLDMRSVDGVVKRFRKVEAGEFPDAAVRALERRRGGVDAWEEEPTDSEGD